MNASLPSLARLVPVGLGMALLLSCAPLGESPSYEVRVVGHVEVRVNGCGTSTVMIEVDPIIAAVRVGGDLDWHLIQDQADPIAVDSVTIRAKEANRWPFAWGAPPGQRERRAAPRGQPVEGRAAMGPRNRRYPYSVVVHCNNVNHDYDPEIIIW